MIVKNKDEAWEKQTIPEGPHAWIQWKGTDVCMDIRCKCGELGHVDAMFAYHVRCPKCNRVYFCNGHIELIELEETPDNCVVDMEVDDD